MEDLTAPQDCWRPQQVFLHAVSWNVLRSNTWSAQTIKGLRFVDYYKRVRRHSTIAYVPPLDKLEGREPQIFAERDHKLAEARRPRQLRCQNALPPPPVTPSETIKQAMMRDLGSRDTEFLEGGRKIRRRAWGNRLRAGDCCAARTIVPQPCLPRCRILIPSWFQSELFMDISTSRAVWP